MYRYVRPERLISIFPFLNLCPNGLAGRVYGGSEDLLIHLMKVSEYMIACTSHLSQKAAEIALDMPEEEIKRCRFIGKLRFMLLRFEKLGLKYIVL